MTKNESKPINTSNVRFYRVPEHVINAWDRGEYFTGGVPSLAYKHLGNALRLRGLYRYVEDSSVSSAGSHDFKGIAKIELVAGRELVMEGIRLWADNKPDIRFWKTEFSHFLSENKIIWTYQVFDCNSDNQVLKHLADGKLPKIKKNSSLDFGLPNTDWQSLQQYLLSNEFDEDLRTVELNCSDEKIIKVMLHFDLPPDGQGDIKAQYRQLRSVGQDISGDSLFERIG